MKNGFIYRLSKILVTVGYYTNLVELIKWLFALLTKDNKRAFKNSAIDIFIILKWVFLLTIWSINKQSLLLTIFVAYLIWTNLFTYFYYHVWTTFKLNDTERNQRRFINLILAFAFSNVCFAYLYSLPFSTFFKVNSGFEGRLSYFLFSSYNSLFSDYNFIAPIDMTGSILTLIQLSITFIFVSIVLTKSIPE